MDSASAKDSEEDLQQFLANEKSFDALPEESEAPEENYRLKDILIQCLGWALFCGACSYQKWTLDNTRLTPWEDVYAKSLLICFCSYIYMLWTGASPYEIDRQARTKLFVMSACAIAALFMFG